MEKIKTIVVDDEPLARKRLQNLLKEDDEIELLKLCRNGKEAIETILKYSPDLVFLDIQMPEIDGFEVIRRLNMQRMPIIIFVTAYDEYALDAFEVHALDYLLKPFDKKRFYKALNRAKDYLKNSTNKFDSKLESLVQELNPTPSYLNRLMVKTSGRVFFVGADEIEWIEASGNYVQLHTGDKSYLIRETMSNMGKKLNPDKFYRIHRSTIVNIECVKELQSWFHGDYMVIMKNGEKLTMSRNYKDLLQKY